jgi:signal transduction histidine kinase
MPSGGTLRIRVRHIGEGSPRPRTRVSIADTGSGIPVELRDKVFEPFVSTKGDTGTGLGLWVSKEIIENHFGSLRVRSSTDEECHGSVFSIYLPVFPPSSAKN